MPFALQIEPDFRLLFGEVTVKKFLQKWPTNFKENVIKEKHRVVPTTELLELMHNAESVPGENGMAGCCWLYRYGYCANLRYMWHSANLIFFCRMGQ